LLRRDHGVDHGDHYAGLFAQEHAGVVACRISNCPTVFCGGAF
jgi:hypothetical protein